MPAPAFVNLGSGMDTGKVIEQLMDLERIPVQRLKEDSERNKLLIKGWEEVRNRTYKLQEASRELYSYAGPFATREVESSDKGAITGEAAPNVQDVDQNIQIVRLAGFHQIHSDPVDEATELPEAKFSIRINGNSKEIDFRGGSIKKLIQTLQKEKDDSFDVFTIKTDSTHSLLGIRSMVSGEKGKIEIEDPTGIFKTIGMIGPVPPEEESVQDLPFSPSVLQPVDWEVYKASSWNLESRYTIARNGEELNLNAGSGVRYVRELPGTGVLEWGWISTPQEDSDSPEGKPGDNGPLPETNPEKPEMRTESVNSGSEGEFHVGSVTLKGYGLDRSREVEAPTPANEAPTGPEGSDQPEAKEEPEETSGVLVFWKDGSDTRSQKIDSSKFQPSTEEGRLRLSLDEVTGGKPATAIAFFTGKGNRLQVVRPVLIEGGENSPLEGPMHVTEKAEDALLKINGVEVTRSENRGLTDVIPGVKLNLHRTTQEPVQVSVKVNAEKVTKRIKDWIEAYNDLLKFLRENSYAAEKGEFQANRPDQTDKDIGKGLDALRNSQGVFASDATVRRLVTDLRSIVGDSYFTPDREGYRVLSDIGIHTGGPGQNWEEIKHGYLQIDEDKLFRSISQSPENVRALFASDRNSDAVVDTGVAFRMNQQLAPYTRRAGGLITARIDSLNTKIDDNKKQADDLELSVKGKEERLRQKFGKMEQSIRESKSVGSYLKNNLKTD